VIEESGSTMLPANLEKSVLTYAATIAESISYVGAGTVEFIFDLERNEVYFMEMNTRLQVEHPVTEAVTGLDIVMAQFRIAAGESIDSMVPAANGYSMELRINAEKPSTGPDGTLSFVPCPGEVTKFQFPDAPGISLIRAVDEGRMVTPYYDGMIVQLIVHASDRKKAIRTLREYLDKVEIQGICTNIPLLKRILDDKIFTKGIYDTTYLKEFTSRLDTISLTKEMEDAAGLSSQSLDMDALRITGTNELRLPAPSAGVFYRTPTPGDPEFVRPGDVIDVYRTLCLLEAMKTFSSLSLSTFRANDTPLFPAGQFYEVVRIVPENGQAVNRDDLLFVIRPAAAGAIPRAHKRED
jgi:acetyl/propionyl-CoA carboxylase alpha subunit